MYSNLFLFIYRSIHPSIYLRWSDDPRSCRNSDCDAPRVPWGDRKTPRNCCGKKMWGWPNPCSESLGMVYRIGFTTLWRISTDIGLKDFKTGWKFIMNDLTWSRSRCFKDPVSLHVDTWVIISIVLACFTTSYEGDYVDETTQIIWPLALVGMPVWIAFIVCHSQYMGWIILGHSCWSHSPAVRFPSGLASCRSHLLPASTSLAGAARCQEGFSNLLVHDHKGWKWVILAQYYSY